MTSDTQAHTLIENSVRELVDVTPATVAEDMLRGNQPVVFRGLVKDWPVVQAATQSYERFHEYLKALSVNSLVNVSTADKSPTGYVSYNENLTGLTAKIARMPFDQMLDLLSAEQGRPNSSLVYMGSTTADTCLPAFRQENDLPVPSDHPLVSLWLGTQTRIPAHYDLPDNLACVAAGKRRFILFPPEQVENLYVGPLDYTPAGQSVSMVDFHAIDFDRFPKFKTALDHAVITELDAGDAIFIPSMWWHHIEGLAPYNLLVNYWWRQSPAYMGPPQAALEHALLSLRDLPPAQKQAWKTLFDHYVFDHKAENFNHIPEEKQGIIGPHDDQSARRLRAAVLQKLNR